MELREPIEQINSLLKRDYGIANDGNPKWRVVWSNTQTEKRWMTHTDEGWELVYPEVRLVKKYQHIHERYVLELYTPIEGETDLVTTMSYEPIWTFEDRFHNYLPPRFDACQMIIEAMHKNTENAGVYRKYKDPDESPEARHQKVLDMEETLFGNETPVGDALAYKTGVVVPGKTNKGETIQ